MSEAVRPHVLQHTRLLCLPLSSQVWAPPSRISLVLAKELVYLSEAMSHVMHATQDGQVMVKNSDKVWSTGEGNGNPLQYSCLENSMDSMKDY